tara:strand:+ start:379 stop:543 length:165 start_codon:yes stop_codon:yes gene_type:complete
VLKYQRMTEVEVEKSNRSMKVVEEEVMKEEEEVKDYSSAISKKNYSHQWRMMNR